MMVSVVIFSVSNLDGGINMLCKKLIVETNNA
jgi:hypothetical protein